MQQKMNSIINKIEEYSKIIILRHKRPDGDALGAAYGLRAILKETYPDKKIYALGKDKAEYLKFLGSDDVPLSEEEYKDALVIVLDTGNKDRVSDDYFEKANYIIKIDHHIPLEDYGDMSWVEEESGAVCCMITKLWAYNQERLKINEEAARCLYTGITTDTGRFKYSCGYNDAFMCANELMKTTIDLEKIYSNLYLKNYEDILVSGALSKKIKMTENGVAYLYVTKKLQKKYKLNQEQASNTVGLMDSIKESIIYIAFIDNLDSSIRVRLRSRFVDINTIAEKYHGGGHAKASGATVYSKKEMIMLLIDADKLIKDYKEKNEGWL